MKTGIHFFFSYLAHLFLEWEMFETKFVEAINTHIWFSIKIFPPELYALYEKVEKWVTAG